ncbi:hypothetical protein D3C87_755150 [compost metagenome]
MSELMKHIGKTSNTDRRLVVVFMQIPQREDHALVIDTDALPSRFHDDLMAVVQGEGQNVPVLGDLLGRRVMPYSGNNMLATLHAANALQAIPVNNVIMLPAPNHPIALSELLKIMGKAPNKPEVAEQVQETVYRDNRIVENQEIDRNDQKYQIAANILAEAELLADESNRKREQAYQMYPALRPVARTPIDTKIEETSAPVEAVKAKRKSPTKKNTA